MIYVDTSIVLAELLAEDRRPAPALWEQTTVSSRLLEYETWVRIHARSLAATHGEAARLLLARFSLLEMLPEVLSRAIDSFPVAVRTLDALHLASVEFLRSRNIDVQLATFDHRMLDAAKQLGIPIYPA
ncbi:MAG: PIN domain-containing protein [Myxococcales bacterium]|nr:PIN domain-containing protein [Myxococcales bacterium]